MALNKTNLNLISSEIPTRSICEICNAKPTLSKEQRYKVCDSPVSKSEGKILTELFDCLVLLMNEDQQFAEFYNNTDKFWRNNPQNRHYYAGFFKNYFRNREDQSGYDDKVVWQVSKDFIEQLRLCLVFTNYANHKVIDLINLTDKFLQESIELMEPSIDKLCSSYPELRKCLLGSERELPCTIRIMRYRSGNKIATAPHVDKSVLSCIFWNSDPNSQQKLAFSADASSEHDLSSYRSVEYRTERKNSPAYLFWGAALAEADYALPPTSHAVLPINDDEYRYSIAAFWLLPYFDMSEFTTASPLSCLQDEKKLVA